VTRHEPLAATAYPFHRFSGSHLEVGRQYGEQCRDLIVRHYELAIERLGARTGLTAEDALDRALEYRGHVQRHAGFLDEEIQGLAEGARLSLGQAYLLQLRAELNQARGDQVDDECTTFAALSEATADGAALAGQNADLPSIYSELGVVVQIAAGDRPEVLMLTPAGQISYIGINDVGVCVFGNFLTCDGWRVGFPRYLLTRLVLAHGSIRDALATLDGVPRASSRNLMMLDASETAADLETTPTRSAVLEPEDGWLAHSNHYVADELTAEETADPVRLENSRTRLDRIRQLLAGRRGELDARTMAGLFRDRANFPHALCVHPGDREGIDTITFASVIAEPSRGRMWVSSGPPSENEYRCFSFADGDRHEARL